MNVTQKLSHEEPRVGPMKIRFPQSNRRDAWRRHFLAVAREAAMGLEPVPFKLARPGSKPRVRALAVPRARLFQAA